MKRKSEGQTSMDLEKPVALSDDQVAELSTRIRTLRRLVKATKAEMRKEASENKKAVEEAEAEMDRIIELVDQGIELRKQGDLFAGDEAKRALHDVAKKVDPKLAGGNGGADGSEALDGDRADGVGNVTKGRVVKHRPRGKGTRA